MEVGYTFKTFLKLIFNKWMLKQEIFYSKLV